MMTNGQLRVVLVRPEQPRNVGAVVRAAANFGAESVWLVGVTDWTDEHDRLAQAASSGAWQVLGGVRRVGSIAEATGDCHAIAGTSSRTRADAGRVMSPREYFGQMCRETAEAGIVLVLGPESQGLSRAELAQCHVHVCIDAQPDFPSLNLGHAAAVLLYEWRRCMAAAGSAMREMKNMHEGGLAPAADQEMWLAKVEQLLPTKDTRQIGQLRRLLARAAPTSGDIALLQNILKSCSNRTGRD